VSHHTDMPLNKQLAARSSHRQALILASQCRLLTERSSGLGPIKSKYPDGKMFSPAVQHATLQHLLAT
jgi:hypothetical protein